MFLGLSYDHDYIVLFEVRIAVSAMVLNTPSTFLVDGTSLASGQCLAQTPHSHSSGGML